MSVQKECKWCHLKSSTYVTETASCSQCGHTVTLCERCTFTWKNQKCPGCGMGPANANWKFGSSKSSSDSADIPMGFVKSQQQTWRESKEKIAEKRSQEGPETHNGVKLSAQEVDALRRMEDIITHEIQLAGELGKYKLQTFGAKDGKLVELSLSHKESTDDSTNLIEIIGQLTNLEALKFESARKQDVINPLTNLKNLKKLMIHTSNQQFLDEYISVLGNLTQLEELCLMYNEFNVDLLNSAISKLRNLRKLKLSTKSMQKPLPCIKDLPNLEELDVTGSGIQMWGGGWNVMPKIKLVHTDMNMQSAISGFGSVKEALERNNPEVYPKLSLKDKLKKGVANLSINDPTLTPEQAWKKNLPEPLRKGWSGIK